MSTSSPIQPSFTPTAPSLPPYQPPPPASKIPTSALTTTSSPSPFTYPREHSFPPFYTRQPTLQTHHAQLQKWSSLILAYCRHNRLFKLSLIDSLDSPLFYNQRIRKRLGISDVKEVVEFMRREGRAEWVGKGGENSAECWIWWRTPEEWASGIYEWIDETAQKNTVLTLYELTESEATLSQEFHGMDPDLLQRVMNILVKRGKAQVFGQEDQQGVKFF
ncbi:Vacuolar protein-sorting-associated protein 25 [Lachnellula cervina]|uniref:Vacuolar protein-sorting-associated protein 25 n=1 Tax=Lachnellula cervina TaxID=1316786 RepID=A0A7D8YU04_9HELO|nr:Vacuolar protein-sorting-associated protein 25 [Lachnellula cervina]